MKIDNSGKPISGTGVKASYSRSSASSEVKAENATKPTDDNVELTPTSLKLQSLKGSAGNPPVVDAARVSEIKQAIADGKFKINADAIADKLVASVKELLADRKG